MQTSERAHILLFPFSLKSQEADTETADMVDGGYLVTGFQPIEGGSPYLFQHTGGRWVQTGS